MKGLSTSFESTFYLPREVPSSEPCTHDLRWPVPFLVACSPTLGTRYLFTVVWIERVHPEAGTSLPVTQILVALICVLSTVPTTLVVLKGCCTVFQLMELELSIMYYNIKTIV